MRKAFFGLLIAVWLLTLALNALQLIWMRDGVVYDETAWERMEALHRYSSYTSWAAILLVVPALKRGQS